MYSGRVGSTSTHHAESAGRQSELSDFTQGDNVPDLPKRKGDEASGSMSPVVPKRHRKKSRKSLARKIEKQNVTIKYLKQNLKRKREDSYMASRLVESLKAENNIYRMALGEANERLSNYATSPEELIQQRDYAIWQLSGMAQDLTSLYEKYEKLNKDNNATAHQVKSSQVEIGLKRDRIHELEDSILQLKEKIEKAELQAEEKMDQFLAEEIKHKMTQEVLDQTQIKCTRYEMHLKSKETEIEVLERKSSELAKQCARFDEMFKESVSECNDAIEIIQQSMPSAEDLFSSVVLLTNELEALRDKQKYLESEQDKLYSSSKELLAVHSLCPNKLDSLTETNLEQAKLIDAQRQTMEKTLGEFSEQSKSMGALNDQLVVNAKSRETLSQQLASLTHHFQVLSSQSRTHEDTIRSVTEDKNAIQLELAKVCAENKILKMGNETLEQEHAQLRCSLELEQGDKQKIILEREQVRQELDKTIRSNRRLIKDNVSKTDTLIKDQLEFRVRMKNEIETLEEEIAALRQSTSLSSPEQLMAQPATPIAGELGPYSDPQAREESLIEGEASSSISQVFDEKKQSPELVLGESISRRTRPHGLRAQKRKRYTEKETF